MSKLIDKIASKFPWFDVVKWPKKEIQNTPKALGYAPGKGHVWNPLRSFPVNLPCFCGSKIKAKNCCLPNLARTMNEKDAKSVLINWDKIISGKLELSQKN